MKFNDRQARLHLSKQPLPYLRHLLSPRLEDCLIVIQIWLILSSNYVAIDAATNQIVSVSRLPKCRGWYALTQRMMASILPPAPSNRSSALVHGSFIEQLLRGYTISRERGLSKRPSSVYHKVIMSFAHCPSSLSASFSIPTAPFDIKEFSFAVRQKATEGDPQS